MKTYTQCGLSKKTDKGELSMTSWIPSKFAKKNKVIKIRYDSNSEWEDGWKVVTVGATMSSEGMVDISTVWKKTRKASDI